MLRPILSRFPQGIQKAIVFFLPIWLSSPFVAVLFMLDNDAGNLIGGLIYVVFGCVAGVPYLQKRLSLWQCMGYGPGVALLIYTLCIATKGAIVFLGNLWGTS